MAHQLQAFARELAVIRRARRNGRRLGIEPLLTDGQTVRGREAFLSETLQAAGLAQGDAA